MLQILILRNGFLERVSFFPFSSMHGPGKMVERARTLAVACLPARYPTDQCQRSHGTNTLACGGLGVRMVSHLDALLATWTYMRQAGRSGLLRG